MVGAQLTLVTVPAQLWSITRDSAMVGLCGLFALVPMLVFGLWGGAIADARDRRLVLLVTTIGIIATSFLFFLQAFLDLRNPWLILGIFAVQQSFFAVNSPARNAIMPSLVPDDELPAANALTMMLYTFGAIAGPLVGGALLPLLGYPWLYLLDTIFLFATLWAVFLLPPLQPSGGVRRAGLASVIGGLAYLRGRTVVWMSFVVDLVAMIFGMPRVLFPQQANLDFGGPLDGGMELAILFAAIPAGGLIGGIFSGWVSRVRHHGRAILVCIMIWGAGILAYGLCSLAANGRSVPWLGLGFVVLGIAGAADLASSSFRQSILLQAASDEVRGRLQGLMFIVVVGGPRVADLLHGVLAGRLGASGATVVGAVAVLALIPLCALLAPTFRGYTASVSGQAHSDSATS